MIVYKRGGYDTPVILLPLCQTETARTFTVTITPDEELSNAFLYTDGDWTDTVEAKLTSGSTYYFLSTYSKTPKCYLGTMLADTAYSVDVRITFPSGTTTGEHIVPIYLGYGDDIYPRYLTELTRNIFFRPNSDDPFQWFSSSDECDTYMWTEIS